MVRVWGWLVVAMSAGAIAAGQPPIDAPRFVDVYQRGDAGYERITFVRLPLASIRP
jgi:hypothetical protein